MNHATRQAAARWLVAATVLLVAACTLLPPAPKNPAEAIAATYATIAAAAETLDARNAAGTITLEQARKAGTMIAEAQAATEAAEIALRAGDPTTAEGRLDLAIAILSRLEEELR